jgi:FHS family L-fucose permease-like MFS transporter
VADHFSTALAYLLPLGCFVVVAFYGKSGLRGQNV